jgi:hypothetical protein
MKRRPYNPQFAAPIKSRRDRLDEAVERDNQVAARRTREYEAAQARETLPGAEDNIVCAVLPAGWHCTRNAGHSGPCAAHPAAPEAPASEPAAPLAPTYLAAELNPAELVYRVSDCAPAAPHAQAEPVYQVDVGNGWRDVQKFDYDLYVEHSDGSIKTRTLYAAPVPQEAEQPIDAQSDEAVSAATWKFCDQCNGGYDYNGEDKCLHCDGEGTVAAEPFPAIETQEAEQAAPAAVMDERAFFEQAYAKQYPTVMDITRYKLERDEQGDYENGAVFVAWELWQARAALAQPAAPAVAWMLEFDDERVVTADPKEVEMWLTQHDNAYEPTPLCRCSALAVTDDVHTLNTTDLDGQKDEKFEHKAAPAVTEAEQASVLAARAAALEEAEEAAEILESFISNVSTDGPYSTEATLTFISQAKQCVDAAIRALINPATTKG